VQTDKNRRIVYSFPPATVSAISLTVLSDVALAHIAAFTACDTT
jgi:hypothetical protein